jgi:probable addiction module antidote protein
MTTPLKTKPFDAAEYLDDEAAVAAYLADAFESGDDAVFQEALQTAARARGMSEVARNSGLGRESLYKALQADALPRFTTVRKVMSALGVELTFVARKPAAVGKRATTKVTKQARRGTTVAAKALPTKPARAKTAAKRA